MKIQNISFGKKIPTLQCSVKDVENNRSVRVTLSEYDVKEYSDIEEIFSQCGKWKYGSAIAADMYFKYINQENFNYEKFPYKFYAMEDEEKNIIGICETEDSDHNVNISFLESAPNKKYKYTGQAMIASVGKMLSERKGHNIYVMSPVSYAIDFYMQKCNFEPLVKNRGWESLIMQSERIPGFIKDVETKTGGKIINIKG